MEAVAAFLSIIPAVGVIIIYFMIEQANRHYNNLLEIERLQVDLLSQSNNNLSRKIQELTYRVNTIECGIPQGDHDLPK